MDNFDEKVRKTRMNKEYIVTLPPIGNKIPFMITLTGITYENPNYSIERYTMNTFTAEYVISGKGYIEANGKKHSAEAGDTYILNYGTKLHYYSDEIQPWKKIWFNASGSLLNEALRLYGLEKEIVFRGVDTYEFISKILHICENEALPAEEKNRKCAGIYVEMLGYMAERTKKTEAIRDEAVLLKNYLDMNTEKNVTVAELARLIYRSESQTIRIFKQSFNITPYEYLLENKIIRAKHIIQSTNLPIKEIAYRFGFADEHYFSGIFKKKTGFAPTQYRKMV